MSGAIDWEAEDAAMADELRELGLYEMSEAQYAEEARAAQEQFDAFVRDAEEEERVWEEAVARFKAAARVLFWEMGVDVEMAEDFLYEVAEEDPGVAP